MNRVDDLVSVIIPCYNHGHYLLEAIDSIQQQTYQNFEIIIVDDGSTDSNTKRVLNEIDHPKITVYRKKNGGIASARNYGIERSRGEFILTLDADDKFAPEFLEKALSVLKQHPDVGMVTSFHIRFNSEGEIGRDQLKGGDVTAFLNKNNAVACLLYRYKCWVDAGGYDEKIPGFEDWEFNLNVTKRGWKVHSMPEFLTYFRFIDDSEYDKALKKRPEIIKYIVEKHKELFQKHVIDLMYDKESNLKDIIQLEKKYSNSFSQKIGSTILQPFRWVRKLIRQ